MDQMEKQLPFIGVFLAVMAVDCISGILAAQKEAIEDSDAPTLDSDRRKGILRGIRKFGYVLIVCVAFLLDYILSVSTEYLGISISEKISLGWITVIWLIANEILSIIENLGRMGVPVPAYLKKLVEKLKQSVEEENKKDS